MDASIVKKAASGRWSEFFVSLGVPSKILSGNNTEHPCPKCGGNTRFRLIDQEAGALFCSHCFREKNGDGLAAIQWWTDCDFQEAIQKAAEFFGVKDSKKKPAKKTPEDFLDFRDNDSLIAMWLTGQPQISMPAVKDSGGRVARFNRDTVIAFPYHGESKTTGYEMRPVIPGGKIHRWNDKNKKYETRVKDSCNKSTKNLMGPMHLVKDAKVIVRVEGLTDLLVANTVLPEGWVAVAVPGSMNPKPWQLKVFKDKDVVIVGDTDDSGRDSAETWAQGAAKHAASVKVPVLPFIHTESGGKDLKDFVEQHGIESFLTLVENTAAFKPEKDASGKIKEIEPPAEDEQKFIKCLQDLGLDVFGETDDSQIYVYATTTRKTRVISGIDRMKIENLIQIVGKECLQYVTSDPDSFQYALSTVRRAIASAASGRQIDPDTFKGRGIWLIDGQVVAANGNHLSIWEGESLTSSDNPRIGDSVFQLTGLADNWFDHEEMADLCQHARDTQWCRATMNQLITLLERWTWANEKISPHLICSMVAATFLQSAWRIRPQIGISGTSGSGKSDLMRFLFGDGGATSGVFGHLRWSSGDTSGSGLTQSVKNNSLCIAVDEWDKIKPRYKNELREILRNMSSGQSRDRGSSHGKGRKEMLCHMLWFAGISLTMEEAADRNRVVQVGLVKEVGSKKWANFIQPGGREAIEIGKRLVAAVIVHGAQAITMAVDVELAAVSDPANKDVDSRLLRIMSVPAACASAFSGGDFDGAKNASRQYVSFVLSDEEHETPESYTDLLNQVLAADVDLGHGEKRPLSQILASYTARQSVGPALEAHGVKIVGAGDTRALAIGKIAKLVKESNDRDARRLLMQCPGAARGKVRIAGRSQRAVVIPWETLDVGVDDTDDSY